MHNRINHRLRLRRDIKIARREPDNFANAINVRQPGSMLMIAPQSVAIVGHQTGSWQIQRSSAPDATTGNQNTFGNQSVPAIQMDVNVLAWPFISQVQPNNVGPQSETNTQRHGDIDQHIHVRIVTGIQSHFAVNNQHLRTAGGKQTSKFNSARVGSDHNQSTGNRRRLQNLICIHNMPLQPLGPQIIGKRGSCCDRNAICSQDLGRISSSDFNGVFVKKPRLPNVNVNTHATQFVKPISRSSLNTTNHKPPQIRRRKQTTAASAMMRAATQSIDSKFGNQAAKRVA
jgi:hypothetical protein